MEFSVGMVVNTIRAITVAKNFVEQIFTMDAGAWSIVPRLLFRLLLLPLKIFRSAGCRPLLIYLSRQKSVTSMSGVGFLSLTELFIELVRIQTTVTET